MDTTISIMVTVVVLLFLFALSFFFSMSETALIGLSKIKLRHMLAKGVRRAALIQRLSGKMDKVIAAILIGNNFVNMAISAIATVVFIHFFGQKLGLVLSTLISASLVVVLCEVTPKILATKNTERISLLVAPLMDRFVTFFNPMVQVVTRLSNTLLKAMRVEVPKRSPLVTEEEFRLLIEVGREEGVLTDEERRMLHRIFEFGDIKIKDVMIPKEKIVSVNITSSADDVLDTFAEQGHARLPVYSGSADNIIGIIYARDLLYILRDKGLFVLSDLIHAACYVEPAMRVNELLRKFQAQKIQMAVVVDSQRRAIGVVTLEDLIEEIVGEIEEAHPASNHK